MKLSKNLTLAECMKSQTATRHGIDNSPSYDQFVNLKEVANQVFQPLRDHFGVPLAVTSGFRCMELNRRIGGSSTSSHCKGEALDIDAHLFGAVTNKELFDFIRENLGYDQLIWEFGTNQEPAWVHVSFTCHGNRGQVLKAQRVDGRTSYNYM